MKRVFGFILLAFLLSGCSLDYELKFDENLIIEEKIVISEKSDIMNSFTINKEGFIEENINNYASDPEFSYYNFSKNIDNSNSSGIAKALYMDFLHFKKTNTTKDYFFSSVSMLENKNLVTLNFIANDTNELFEDTFVESSLLNSARIKIIVPFKVIESNADSIDKEEKAYIWNYNKEDYKKNIHLVFDTSKKPINIRVSPWFIIIGGFILITGMISLYIYYRYKNNSKF